MWATAVSVAWAMKGTAVCAQVSRRPWLAGRKPWTHSSHLAQPLFPCPQWQICARRGMVAAARLPTAARWGQWSPVPVCLTMRVMAGVVELVTPAEMATVEAAVSMLTASTLVR